MPGAVQAKPENRCVCEHHRRRHYKDGPCDAGVGFVQKLTCRCRRYSPWLGSPNGLAWAKKNIKENV